MHKEKNSRGNWMWCWLQVQYGTGNFVFGMLITSYDSSAHVIEKYS